MSTSLCPSRKQQRKALFSHILQLLPAVGVRAACSRTGLLSPPQDLDAPLRLAAQRKINGYRQQYVDNQNISFLPAIAMNRAANRKAELMSLLEQVQVATVSSRSLSTSTRACKLN
jgi:hypothetical protein